MEILNGLRRPPFGFAGCSDAAKVSVALARLPPNEANAMGIYSVVNVTQADRPVYANAHVSYLFFVSSSQQWCIGSNYTADCSSGWRSAGPSAATCPEDASDWQYFVPESEAWQPVDVLIEVGSITIGNWRWSCASMCLGLSGGCAISTGAFHICCNSL